MRPEAYDRSMGRFLIVLLTALALPASATAAVKATISVQRSATAATVTVVVTGAAARPASASVTFGKSVITLKRVSGNAKRSTWRSSAVTGARRAAIVAGINKRVAVKVTISGRTRTLRATATETVAAAPNDPGTPTTPATPNTPAAPTSLFGTPATALTGQQALEALQPYLVDARFTDCVAGWPNCAVEERYSAFPNGDHWYCRLTSSSGSDIKSYGSSLTITGAQQATDGSWAISYAILSYGNITNYRWDVTPLGAATGQYWGPGVSTGGPPSQVIPGLQWVRGARDCSY